MKSRIKGLVVIAMALVPLVAAATTLPASGGKAVVWSDNSCFAMASSTMRNNCTTTKSLEFPLAVDSSGSKTVDFTAFAASPSNNVGCIAVGVNREVTAGWSSPRLWLTAFNTVQTIRLTGAYVPTAGHMYVNCDVNPGGVVYAVYYNP